MDHQALREGSESVPKRAATPLAASSEGLAPKTTLFDPHSDLICGVRGRFSCRPLRAVDSPLVHSPAAYGNCTRSFSFSLIKESECSSGATWAKRSGCFETILDCLSLVDPSWFCNECRFRWARSGCFLASLLLPID
eukprot:scaffold1166_cov261-Pinguiococcus_pyrenoidosus.AAC.42